MSLISGFTCIPVGNPLRSMLRGWSLLVLFLLCAPSLWAADDEWQGVKRIVAVGDLHGDYDNYLQVLREAGVVSRRGKWSGGDTHLVQLGDVPDRGPDTDRIIEHLQKLEKQAAKAGGHVHALIGNHEAMNIVGDLRYVDPGEFAALKSRNAKALRENYYQRVVAYLESQPEPTVVDEAFRDKWLETHPLGFVEHRQRWHPSGDFGGWVTKHNTVIKINNLLFMHAGLGPAYADMSIRDINERIRQELTTPGPAEQNLFDAEDGPLWYRGLAQSDTEEEAAHLNALLDHFGVDHIVVGHTPGYGTVVPRFGARVLAIDSGIADYYGGYRASLRVDEGQLFTVQRGEQVPIPQTEDGLLPYFRKINELEPGVNNLMFIIRKLENPEAVNGEAALEDADAAIDGEASAAEEEEDAAAEALVD